MRTRVRSASKTSNQEEVVGCDYEFSVTLKAAKRKVTEVQCAFSTK